MNLFSPGVYLPRWLFLVIGLLLAGLSDPPAMMGFLQDEPVAEPVATPAATPVAAAGAPVVVNDQELFRLHARIGSITATERAALVSDHISRLANNPFAGDLTVTIHDVEGASNIIADGGIMVSVTDADAAAEGRDRQELAQGWAAIIQAAIAEGQAGWSARALAEGAAITIAVLLGFILLFWLINRFGNWLCDKLDPATESGYIPQTLARSEVYRSGLFSRFVQALLRIFKIVLAFFLIIFAIPLILESFPQTSNLGHRLRRLLLDPVADLWDGFVGFLDELVFLLVLALLTWAIIRLIRLFFREVERGNIRIPSFEPEWATFTSRMIDFLLIIIAAIIGFTSLSVSRLPFFQGISAFVALLLTLASSSAISNIIAGVILTYTGSFHLGDIVEIEGAMGEVVGKYLLTTRIRTFKNEVVSIPNSNVLTHSVTNFSRMAHEENGLTLHTTITIGYDIPWPQVHKLLIAAALDCEDILKEPPPFVLQTSLNDHTVSYELNAYSRKPEILLDLYSALHQHVQERFDAAGVEIMSPAYVALRDGTATTLPPEFVPDGSRPSDGSRPPGDRAQPKDHGQTTADS